MGGGVLNKGNLTITNGAIVNNSAGWDGGGVANVNGIMTITDGTTIANNWLKTGAAVGCTTWMAP